MSLAPGGKLIPDASCETGRQPAPAGDAGDRSQVVVYETPVHVLADSVERVSVEAIVLNGGSSSGKSSLARCLQGILGPSWLTLGVDDLIRALPGGDKPSSAQPSIDFVADGSIRVSDDFRRAEAAWYQGLAAIARCDTGLIIDEVFLGGRASQERLAQVLSDLTVLWVGVRCDPEVAAGREGKRQDRIVGMARLQAEQVMRASSMTSWWTRPAQVLRSAQAPSPHIWPARDSSVTRKRRYLKPLGAQNGATEHQPSVRNR